MFEELMVEKISNLMKTINPYVLNFHHCELTTHLPILPQDANIVGLSGIPVCLPALQILELLAPTIM